MRFIKIGSTVAALLALMGMMSASASAASFQATSYPNMLVGEQVGEHAFKLDGSIVKCSTATFASDEFSGASEELAVSSSYSGCTAFGFVGATVSMNKCHKKLKVTGTGFLSFHIGTRTTCTTAGSRNIVIHASTAFGTCEVEVGEQEPSGVEAVTNVEEGGVKRIKTEANITGIKFNVLKDTGICPLSGTGERTNGTYEGVTILEATGGAGAFVS